MIWRILVLFSLGIYCYNICHPEYFFYLNLSLLFITLGVFLSQRLYFKFSFEKSRCVLSILFYFSFLLFGWVATWYHDPRSKPNTIVKDADIFMVLRVLEPSYGTTKLSHFKACVLFSGPNSAHLLPSSEIIQVHLTGYSGNFIPGQKLLSQGHVSKIFGNYHPAFFNYAQFENIHQVYYQTYLNFKKIRLIEIHKENPFSPASLQIKTSQLFLNTLKDSISSSFLTALLVGLRTQVPDSINQMYIQTGVVHILSISGMHIAVLYGLFLFLFKPLFNQGKWGELIGLSLLIPLLWYYVFITGTSPPVLRSAWMLSFFILARLCRRPVQTNQILASTAFIQLLFSPESLFDLSFQLSYAALFGLITFYSPIQNLFPIQNRILKAFIGSVLSSIAAQLVILPLVLFYFHQYAVYFLLANLWVIPISSIILYQGVAYLCLLLFNLPSKSLATLIIFTIKALNWGVEKIASLPQSHLDGIYLNVIEVLLMIGIIYLLYLLLLKFKIQYLWLITGLILCLYLEIKWQSYQLKFQRIVYIRYFGKSYLGFMAIGKQAYYFWNDKRFHNLKARNEVNSELKILVKFHHIKTLIRVLPDYGLAGSTPFKSLLPSEKTIFASLTSSNYYPNPKTGYEVLNLIWKSNKKIFKERILIRSNKLEISQKSISRNNLVLTKVNTLENFLLQDLRFLNLEANDPH